MGPGAAAAMRATAAAAGAPAAAATGAAEEGSAAAGVDAVGADTAAVGATAGAGAANSHILRVPLPLRGPQVLVGPCRHAPTAAAAAAKIIKPTFE